MAIGTARQKVDGGEQSWSLSHIAQTEVEEGDRCAGRKLYSDAVTHYREALRLAPNMAEAHNNLAWLYVTSDDPKFRNPPAGLTHARRAVQITQWKQVASVDTLAEALYANRDFGNAIQVEAKALRLEPGNPVLWDHMARYRKAAGNVALPRDLQGPPSTKLQSEQRSQEAPATPDPLDRLPLLWTVPGACTILLVLGLFGLPRWPTLLVSLMGSTYFGYFSVTTAQQLTDPQNTLGLLTHTWMWGFWCCWLGLVTPAGAAWLKPHQKT